MPDLEKEKLRFLRRRYENATDPDANPEDKNLFMRAMLNSGEELLDLAEEGLDSAFVLTQAAVLSHFDGPVVTYWTRSRNSNDRPESQVLTVIAPGRETLAADHDLDGPHFEYVFDEPWVEVVGGDDIHAQQVMLYLPVDVSVVHLNVASVYCMALTLEGSELEPDEWFILDDDDDDADEYDEDDDEYDEDDEDEDGEYDEDDEGENR